MTRGATLGRLGEVVAAPTLRVAEEEIPVDALVKAWKTLP